MKDIILRLIALYSVLGELCDLARTNKAEAASELLRLESRIFETLNEFPALLAKIATTMKPHQNLMNEISIRLIALCNGLGILCDLARANETEAANALLRVEPKTFETLDEITELLASIETPRERHQKVRRNAPCPCGSGMKFQEVLFANVYVDDLLTEPDSFRAQLEALRRLARYLKRVPTQDEAMDFLKQRKLHSGSWEDNLANRDRRVRDILRYIAQTFDPAKCAKGSVNVGKYDSWAKKAFPNGLTGQLRGGMTEYMERYSGVTVHVSSSFISVFLSVVEFALLMDRNEDHSLPHNRAEQLWTALNVSVKFDARKWAVCRDQLEKHGVITIIDRNYSSGKAMKWAVGTYFPFLGLWKTKKERSILGPASLPTRRNRTTEQHNTLLQWQSVPSPVLGSLKLPRPPPVAINSS